MKRRIFLLVVFISQLGLADACKEFYNARKVQPFQPIVDATGATIIFNGDFKYVQRPDGNLNVYGADGIGINSIPSAWLVTSFALAAGGSQLVLVSKMYNSLIIVDTNYFQQGYRLPPQPSLSYGGGTYLPRDDRRVEDRGVVRLSPSGKYIAFASDSGGISILEVESNVKVKVVMNAYSDILQGNYSRNRNPNPFRVEWTGEKTFSVEVDNQVERFSVGE